jgi:hypothetical protein
MLSGGVSANALLREWLMTMCADIGAQCILPAMQYTGDKWLAEPCIGHFLWEYACHFPDRESAFASITRRVPFHLGLTLLRIARNSWITGKYRRQLLDEAGRTLR